MNNGVVLALPLVFWMMITNAKPPTYAKASVGRLEGTEGCKKDHRENALCHSVPTSVSFYITLFN
jgi:hypothetical protein